MVTDYKFSVVFLFLIVISSFSTVASAIQNNPPSIQWNKTFGGPDGDLAYSVQQTLDGGYIVGGLTRLDGLFTGWLVKTDATGSHQWNKTYKEECCKTYEQGSFSKINSVQQTSDGGYILLASLLLPPKYGAWLIKTDATGDSIWNRTFWGAGGGSTDSSYVQPTSDGGYVLGAGHWIIKVDASGNQQWNKTFGNGIIPSLRQTSDLGYIIIAWLYDPAGAWIIKIDASGNQQWNKTFGTAYLFNDIQQTSDGGYILAGRVSTNGMDGWLVKVDMNGNHQWNKTFGGIFNERFNSVQQTSDGSYIVAGVSGGYAWLVEVDAGGSHLWNLTVGEAATANAVRQTSDGGYILTGSTSSYGAGGYDIWLLKLSKPQKQTCLDGTAYGSCSVNRPKYCVDGNQIDKASICGCTADYDVSGDNCIKRLPPPDTAKPTISITSPTNWQTFTASTVTVSGTSSDDVALSKVEVKLGTGSWQLASGTTSWSNTVTLTSGSNTIYARVTDISGNIKETSVTVNYKVSAINEPKWIIVHHTAGSLSDTFEDVNRWHKERWPNFISSLGYHIGYHYFIDAAGKVTQGRAENEEGAHTIGKNTESIGICLAGNFSRPGEMPTEAQERKLVELVREIQKRWDIPDENIAPHRKFAAKECYGKNLDTNWVQSLFKKYGTPPTPIPTPTPKPVITPTLTPTEDVFWLAKVIYTEARGNSDTERTAVGWTVLNRLRNKKYGANVEAVKGGFGWKSGPPSLSEYAEQNWLKEQNDVEKKAWDISKEKARELWDGRNNAGNDFTGGALYFFSPRSMPWEEDAPPKGEDHYIARLKANFNDYDTKGGLYKVPGELLKPKVFFPSFAGPEKDWTITESTEYYQTVKVYAGGGLIGNLEWVSGLKDVKNWNFMFYRPIKTQSNKPPSLPATSENGQKASTKVTSNPGQSPETSNMRPPNNVMPQITTTAPPILVSPGSLSESSASEVTLAPRFEWYTVVGADYYGIYISKYPYGGDNVVYSNEMVTGSPFTLPSGVLKEGEKYRWNMRAHNGAGWSSYSDRLYFQTPSHTDEISRKIDKTQPTKPSESIKEETTQSSSKTKSIFEKISNTISTFFGWFKRK